MSSFAAGCGYATPLFEALVCTGARIQVRIDRMQLGHFGDISPIGDGVSEMRIFYGPGYRVYFVQRKNEVVILLSGGNKRTQSKDIARAKELAVQLEL